MIANCCRFELLELRCARMPRPRKRKQFDFRRQRSFRPRARDHSMRGVRHPGIERAHDVLDGDRACAGAADISADQRLLQRAADIGRLEGQTMRPSPGEDTHRFEQPRPPATHRVPQAARRCETVPCLLMPGVRGTGLASEVRHEEDVEVREMIAGLLRLMREIGGENPVRRDLGRPRIAKSDSRGDRLRDRADAADPRRQRPRFDGRTRLQDLLEAATAAPSPTRAWPAHSRHRGQLRDCPRRVEGTIVKRVMPCAWPSGGRAARQRSHSAAPAAASPTSTGPRAPRTRSWACRSEVRPECRQALRMSLSTVKREATCSGGPPSVHLVRTRDVGKTINLRLAF